ncbi:probable radial spoke head 1 homolog at C-terminar half [Coccomyxa sp. Obi]|nr:probable radial spoke head 1 homolog at C-terminar half [Coccomyxa sp. Obi]
MPTTMGSAQDLAWASNVLGLELHRLDQLQSGAVYLLILDAFHANIIPLTKIALGARYEYEFVYNYRLLKSTFERLNIVKFVDRQRLMSSPEPHEHLLRWFHQRYTDVSVRASYDPVKQRQTTQGGDIKSIPVPVKSGKLTTPMADIGGRAIKPSSIPKPSKVPRLELRMATAAKDSSPPKASKIPSPPGPLKAPSLPKDSSPPKAASPPKSARVGFRLASLSAAAATRAGAKTPRLLLARTPRSPTEAPSLARRTSPKTSPTGRTKRGSPGRRLSISAATPRSAAVDPSKAAKPGAGVVFKVSPNSGVQQRTPRLFPAQLPTPRQLSSAFRTPRGSHGPVSESKAGFSHGAIPRNSLMMPRAPSGGGGGLAATTPRLRSSPVSRGTENQPARANRPSQVPKLSWFRKAAQTLSKTANSARLGQEDAATTQLSVQQEPKQPPVDTDTEQECPEPPVDVPSPATNSTATRVLSKSITADSSPADKASGATVSAAATSPAMQRLRALRQQRIASPRDSATRTSLTVKRRLETRPRAAAPDSASSLNSARGARNKPLSARRRNSLSGLDLGAILLSPDKAACLATSSCKIEAADKIAQAAATTVLRAIPELQMALKDIGSSNRDGYLHRGKLRCRRWMVSTMIPRTRELLMHVRQLSQLAVDDPDARARARRCKRLLKELAAAEQSFADVCDQIAKAERFFPVPGIGNIDQAASKDNPADGKAGSRQLEVSLRAVGQAMMDLQELWVELAPHSPWATNAKAAVRHSPAARSPAAGVGPGADLSDEDDLSDDDACSNADDDVAPPAAASPDPLNKKGKAAAVRNTATIMVRCDAGFPSSKDGSESWKSAWPRSPVDVPLSEAAATLSTPTKPAAAAGSPQDSTPQIPQPQGTPPHPNQAPEVATPQRDTRNVPSELRTPVSGPAAGGNALAARVHPSKTQPGLEPSDGVPEWSPCSTLGTSGASSATYSGNSSATYSGSSSRQQGSRAGSPSTVLTPEAGLRTAKRLLLGADATDKARRRGVQAELARFFGCSPIGKGPATVRNVRPPPGPAAAATPVPGHATDEEGKVLPVRKVTFPSGHKYVGQIGNGTMNGLGVYAFDNTQARYEGEFVDGAFEGLGAETFSEGLYVGSFRNGQRHGLGVCHYRNGDYYEGQWRAGVRHGMGMQQCTDGSNYVGGYAAGQRRGCGIYSFPNGDRYEGECAADAPHGHGVYRFAASGAVLEGTWAAGAKQGWAVITVGSQQSYGHWEAGTLMSLAPLEPDALLEDGEEVELEDDEAEERDIAAETARTARAAGLRAIKTADEHWRAAGAMQMELQELLQKAQAAARTARQLAKPLLN